MARFLRLCTWLLALSPGLLTTVQAECSQDCATCSYRLARPTDLNPLACTLECEGKMPSLRTWDACKELLQLSKLELPQDGTSALRESRRQEEGHLLAKKYGGFMKRYGGFMKKMDELYPLEPEEEANGGEILAKRYGGFMKKDAEEDNTLSNSSDALKELLGTGDNREWWMDYQKRYGGFLKRFADPLPSNEEGESYSKEVPEMEKRYGGFMRF
ncbi:proenkephalin [Phyllostomus discolor]|uniref:Proenkephalin-A n=1 Tax=Phyllostomus discolor TaxID=89673 RepID=A0A833ZV96_9CHIR|nr:proenkephalin [Phyllostomus discolor]